MIGDCGDIEKIKSKSVLWSPFVWMKWKVVRVEMCDRKMPV